MTELKETGVSLEKFPRKSLVWLKEQVTKCNRTAVYPNKTTAVTKLYDAYCEVKVDI